jgi:sugar phosphate permease
MLASPASLSDVRDGRREEAEGGTGNGGRYRWVALGLGIVAQAAFAALLTGFPALGPALRAEYDLSLSAFGAVLGAVTAGATFTLVPWGLLTDRIGERRSLTIGLAGAGLALGTSATGGSLFLAGMLFLAGVLGAVTNVASGRVVMGWFDFAERGTAFGLRQAAVPLGGAIAAFTLPALAAGAGARAGLLALGAGCLAGAMACGGWLRDPPASTAGGGPRRGPLRDRRIYRLAVASGLLVAAQAAVIGFVPLFLHEQRGVSEVGAGLALAVIQVVGIVLRVVAGLWSDRLGRRLEPLRLASAAVAGAWLVTPLAFGLPLPVLVPVLVVSGSLAFSWNGLSFNAAAEYGERGRAGTAIALQQTALFASAALIAPLFGWLVSVTSWRAAYLAVALGPVAAWWLLRSLALAERTGGKVRSAGIPPDAPVTP